MDQSEIGSFLTSMFENRKQFAQINGSNRLYDAKFMLIADAVSENIELFSEVIKEEIKLELNRNINFNTKTSKYAIS